MYKILSKIILTFSFVFLGSFVFSIEKAEADCVVTQANFRAINSDGQSFSQFSPSGWYQDNIRPYVYIDVQTSGCNGESVEFSLTEWDDMEDAVLPINSFVPTESLDAGSWNDDDVNGTDITFNPNIGSTTEVALLLAWISSGLSPNLTPSFMTTGIDCNTSLPKCLDNRPIPIGLAPAESNFTIALQAGEDECEQVGDPECIYYVRFNDDPVPVSANSINQVLTLKYNCDGACFEDWAWIQKIEFGGYHPNDPALSEDEEGGNIGSAGEDIEINIQNPIGPSNMTLVDFIQKVIDFALTIGIPIIAIAIIYSGLLFVTARGNDKQLETAKNAFTYAVIGGAILLGSWIFAKLIKETIESIVMIITYYG